MYVLLESNIIFFNFISIGSGKSSILNAILGEMVYFPDKFIENRLKDSNDVRSLLKNLTYHLVEDFPVKINGSIALVS